MLFPNQTQSSKRGSGYELHGVLPNSHVKALNTQYLRSLKRLKPGLKHSIQKTKTMASSPITSWQIDGETIETVNVLGGPKIIADGDCSHEIKRCLLLGRKAMTNLDSILKSRDITLPKKVHLVKAVVFPAVIYGCESWTIKNAECEKTDAFVMLGKTLESPLDSKEIQPANPKGNQP